MRKRFGDKFANAVVAAALLSTSSTTAQVVDHYYLDPKNVAEISKFRSCAGHHFGYDDTFSGIGVREVETDPTETNRSMKHYFSPLQSLRDNGSNNLTNFLEKNDKKDFDKAAEDLRLATRHLGMIVGKVDVEEILGSIFNDFCIGK